MRIDIKSIPLLIILAAFLHSPQLKKGGVVFSGETLSYMEPCGCTHHQLGGISKKITLVNDERYNGWIRIDCGDISEFKGRQDEIKLESIIVALSKMRYDAIGIGEKDLSYPIEFINNLANSNHLKLIATNVSDKKSGKYPFLPSLKITKGGISIYVFSLLDKSFGDEIKVSNPHLEITDPIESLKKAIPKKRNKNDYLWVIVHGSATISRQISKIFPKTNIVFQITHEEEPYPSVKHIDNNSTMVCIGQKGKYLGFLSLPEMKFQVLPLSDEINNSDIGNNIIKDYLIKIKDEGLISNITKSSYPDNLKYKGSDSCGECHLEEMKIYKNTKHSTAFKTLADAGHDEDPECLPCHTTGFYYDSGFKSKSETQDFLNVGCENCHGPGSEHIKNGSPLPVKPDVSTCLSCHNEEHSSTFNFKTYYPKIKHVRLAN